MIYKRINRDALYDWISIGLPFLLFLAHASLLKDWIIDDAGISFAYARNLAQGYGLVSQPGFSPVEGYSNFTWVILMVPFFVTGIFDPIITPKIVSIVLVLASFLVIREINKLTLRHRKLGTAFILTLLAFNTSFVVWTTSGLENSLYILLTTLILWKLIQLFPNETINHNIATLISLSLYGALCALTRPDGILYSIVFPSIMLTNFVLKKSDLRNIIQALIIYFGIVLTFFGSYLLFRLSYFNDILPNTAYAKGGIAYLSGYEIYEKGANLFQSVSVLPFFLVSLIGMFIYAIFVENFNKRILILSNMLMISILIYIMLPADWMPEFRFASPFFVFFYIFVFTVGEITWDRLKVQKLFSIALAFLALVYIITSILSFSKRTHRFWQAPAVPFTYVAERFGYFFNNISKELDIENGSLLAPDLGGTLYYSQLKVYDLGGLTDKTIGRSLGREQTIFYDYVFETLKPTFIHTHQWWAYVSNFDADSRFRQDYIAIVECEDAWISSYYGKSFLSGDYIRKDAVNGQLNILKSIQMKLTEE